MCHSVTKWNGLHCTTIGIHYPILSIVYEYCRLLKKRILYCRGYEMLRAKKSPLLHAIADGGFPHDLRDVSDCRYTPASRSSSPIPGQKKFVHARRCARLFYWICYRRHPHRGQTRGHSQPASFDPHNPSLNSPSPCSPSRPQIKSLILHRANAPIKPFKLKVLLVKFPIRKTPPR